ncbi:hypothetical protein [Erythrobacter fulvus]|uniref:hypothetical protein n=1 Tax=Erythrobacter fulvus TaxID=2987523 RepID=UPI00235985B0|nr:hypothetical protein [Erythrobacter fulvus]
MLAAFAGIAALLVATGAGAFYGSVYAPEKRHYQSVGPNSGQTYPAESPRNGLADVRGIDALAESLIAKPKPRNNDEREQRELAAQESMAVFAYWMFWAVVIQTLLAGGALLAILKDLKQSRESNERALRAYLYFGPIELSSFASRETSDGRRFEVNTAVKNGGQTPAYECVHMGNIVAFTPDEAEAHFGNQREPPRIGMPTPYVVPNGGEVNAAFYSSSDVSESDLIRLRDGLKRLYAYGIVVYHDIFGFERRTRFCFQLESALPQEPPNGGVLTANVLWSLAPFHNDAD